MAHNIHAKAVGQRSLLQKIGNLVPGFRGYQKREEWREVDQIQRDWCHERRPWQPPPMLRQLASATGLRRRDLRFSYLVRAVACAGSSSESGGANQSDARDLEIAQSTQSCP